MSFGNISWNTKFNIIFPVLKWNIAYKSCHLCICKYFLLQIIRHDCAGKLVLSRYLYVMKHIVFSHFLISNIIISSIITRRWVLSSYLTIRFQSAHILFFMLHLCIDECFLWCIFHLCSGFLGLDKLDCHFLVLHCNVTISMST